MNDKYRATFCYTDEAQLKALLSVLTDPQSGWTLFSADTNFNNATRPSNLKLYVAFELDGWRERRCPLEVAVMKLETLDMIRRADLHRVYRMMRLNETLRALHQAVLEDEDENALASRQLPRPPQSTKAAKRSAPSGPRTHISLSPKKRFESVKAKLRELMDARKASGTLWARACRVLASIYSVVVGDAAQFTAASSAYSSLVEPSDEYVL